MAVSGGADSVALLLLAHAALGDRCFAATVDHRLRPESADEAAFVAGLCLERGIAHCVLSGEFPARAGRTGNLSARARAFRYELLETERRRVDAAAVATAHHVDDQVETLAMRLNRGAGLSGLAGIRRDGPGIVRPLLDWRRAELAAIVAGCGIAAVRDPSNTDERFDRARIRKRLDGCDWVEASGWATSAAALAEAAAALDWATKALARERCDIGGNSMTLRPGGLPFELCRRLVLRCLIHVDPTIKPRGAELVRLIDRLSNGQKSTLGGVQVSAIAGGKWHFAPVSPHRSH